MFRSRRCLCDENFCVNFVWVQHVAPLCLQWYGPMFSLSFIDVFGEITKMQVWLMYLPWFLANIWCSIGQGAKASVATVTPDDQTLLM